jgi:tryptophanyl-tRNA synthetase
VISVVLVTYLTSRVHVLPRLAAGTSKMSKSAENDGSRINLLDPPDLISKKIKRCKTDLLVGLEWDNPERPECTNLLVSFVTYFTPISSPILLITSQLYFF